MFDDLDALDEELLAHFGARFPKPTSIGFCDYDIDAADAVRLCSDPRLYANEGLIWTFVRHNRYGMFGDWRDFPAFVGDLAVFCRRTQMMMGSDHGFFFLHLGEHGEFDADDRALLRRWVEDILMPWERPLQRGTLHWCGQDLSYLALLLELGGDVHEVLERNLERSRFGEVTKLARALTDRPASEDELREHFEWLSLADNQTPPIQRFVRPSLVDEVAKIVRAFRAAIPVAPTLPIDEDELHGHLDEDSDPAQVERALITLEGARWHRQDYYWEPTQPFPHLFFEAFEVVPVRLVEAYLSITEAYTRHDGDWDDWEIRWAQGQAVFVHGDGRAAGAFAACVLGHEYPCAKDVLLGMWDALGEPDHPCRKTRIAGARLLMRRLLSNESTRRESIRQMELWDGNLRTEVAMPLLELVSADERNQIETSWAEGDELAECDEDA